MLATASIKLLEKVSANFLPSANTFMYNWNMRELGNIYRGLTSAKSDFYPKPEKVLRLWVHESSRVFRDRLVDETDQAVYDKLLDEVCKECFKGVEQAKYFVEPMTFTSFAGQPGGEPVYLPLPDGDKGQDLLNRTLLDKLKEYNETNSIMDLVLFQAAMDHVCRIARIITSPGGHAMLVGVGGSGKQSLSRLAAFICDYETVQLSVTSKFTVTDLREALQVVYKDAAVKDMGQIFLMTDG